MVSGQRKIKTSECSKCLVDSCCCSGFFVNLMGMLSKTSLDPHFFVKKRWVFQHMKLNHGTNHGTNHPRWVANQVGGCQPRFRLRMHSNETSPEMRHIRVLENRLDKVMIKYNEAEPETLELSWEDVELGRRVEEFSMGDVMFGDFFFLGVGLSFCVVDVLGVFVVFVFCVRFFCWVSWAYFFYSGKTHMGNGGTLGNGGSDVSLVESEIHGSVASRERENISHLSPEVRRNHRLKVVVGDM